MPRTLLFGNGCLTVCLDSRGVARDLYFPHVGLHNHLSGHKIRLGVWCENTFSWTDEGDWHCLQSSDGKQLLKSDSFRITIETKESVLYDDNVWIRLFQVHNHADHDREVRLFTTHDLRIEASDIGDTALWDPELQAVVHYKGFNWFAFAWKDPFEHTTGIKGFDGLEGTWRDAEDGELCMQPIAQGSVDSTISTRANVLARESWQTEWRCLAGHDYDAVRNLHSRIAPSSGAILASDSELKWDEFCNIADELNYADLSENSKRLFRNSLRTIRQHWDEGGALIASLDSDILATNRATYNYFWPRDGAHIASALIRLGQYELPQRMFDFCAELIAEESPYFHQKYRPNGARGASWHPWIADGKAALPIQLDESALIVTSLSEFAKRTTLDLQHYWLNLVQPIANFLIAYRDPITGLPGPSWDLWEERRGFHTVTGAAVAQALQAAASIADQLQVDSDPYRKASAEIRRDVVSNLVCKSESRYARSILSPPSGEGIDTTLDSSLLQLPLLEFCDDSDASFARTRQSVEEKLSIHASVQGIARYQGDYYFRISDRYPGNPWIITTLWLARILSRGDRARSRELIEWCVKTATPTLLLAEQLHPETGGHLSVSPLAWSHAEYIHAVLDYLGHP